MTSGTKRVILGTEGNEDFYELEPAAAANWGSWLLPEEIKPMLPHLNFFKNLEFNSKTPFVYEIMKMEKK